MAERGEKGRTKRDLAKEREARLAAALRENLKKRKAQGRRRKPEAGRAQTDD